MDLYLPASDAGAHPTVLFIHGGSWSGGDKTHFVNAGRRLARSGFVVASVNYRLVPDGVFPNNIEDCRADPADAVARLARGRSARPSPCSSIGAA